MTNNYHVPMSAPDISEAERAAITAVMQTNFLSIGPQIESFERAFRHYTGSAHAIGVSSGTAGLHLCIRAAGISSGDLVITTPFSFVSSSNVILYEQGIPIFVDVDARSGNIDPQQVRQAAQDLMQGGTTAKRWLPRRGANVTQKLKAILPVDVFGQAADLDPIRQVCDQFQLKMIEDSCEALGAQYKGRPVGTIGDYGVFAFYPNKQITTGEGGMIVTNDAQAADYMRALRNQGRAQGDTWLQHTYLGYNYRMDELSAALGVVQMTRLDELLEKRARVADWYQARLEKVAGIELPFVSAETTRVSWFVYVIRVSPGIDRDRLNHLLDEQGIPSRPYFYPIHRQAFMIERYGYQAGDFPVAEDLGQRSLAIPFSSAMTEEQVDKVCQAIAQVINQC